MGKKAVPKRPMLAVAQVCEGVHFREEKSPHWVPCRAEAVCVLRLREKLYRTKVPGEMRACESCAVRYEKVMWVTARVPL